MSIDRCVCTNLTFSALKRTAEREGLDLEGLKACTGCCRSCALCEPYVKKMLATGRTTFPVTAAEVMHAGYAEDTPSKG
jgi:NAD(P)H-nitrite reductase large subunit